MLLVSAPSLLSHSTPGWRTSRDLSRRSTLLSGTVALLAPPCLRPRVASATAFEDRRFLDRLLRSASIYAVNVDPTRRAAPTVALTSAGRFLRWISSQRAVFMGEHHPELRDHLLQAAVLRSLCASGKPLAVGLEAVQRQFQPVLDDYIAGRITEAQLFTATDWQRRWYWSFEYYAPIFRICREFGVKLVALDMDSEDKAKVELGGLAALEPSRLRQYVPDRDGFDRFGSTRAFDAYLDYTLRPPYALMSKVGIKMTASTNAQRSMSFANFLARQTLRDESMACASAAWIRDHPDGLLLGLVGTNHVKFACGVPARTARMLPGGLDVVTSVLLNPTPANTFVDPSDLRLCGRSVVANEACVRNDIEVQNYVLQVPFAATGGLNQDAVPRPGGEHAAARSQARELTPAQVELEAVSAMQAKRGSSSVLLALSDFMIFSPMAMRDGRL